MTASLVAFGVALAATVQVSREVPSTLTVASVVVLPDDNLKLFHDEALTVPVTALEFVGLIVQPPLELERPGQPIFIRNDSGIDLTIIEPCGTVFDGATGTELGFLFTDKTDTLGRACLGEFTIAAGETVRANVALILDPSLAPGTYSFTAVFGATGEQTAPATSMTVRLDDGGGAGPFSFDPADLTFDVGETVIFTFVGESVFHTFTVADLGIDVDVNGGETVSGFQYTFDTPGTFTLICIPHQALGMVGTITVQ